MLKDQPVTHPSDDDILDTGTIYGPYNLKANIWTWCSSPSDDSMLYTRFCSFPFHSLTVSPIFPPSLGVPSG